MSMRWGAALLAVVLLGAAGAPPALAAPGAEIGIEDERLLLAHPEQASAVVERWAAIGVEVVRLHASWREIAPGATARRRPSDFYPRDPNDPAYRWERLDRALGLVHAAGMRVMLTITGPGPLWSSRRPSRGNPRYKPDPREYAAFAGAVARRYGAQVDRYLLWNEPNIAGWLEPQLECVRRRCTPAAPHVYRALVQAALPALKAADPGAEVLVGELAPIGRRPMSERSSMAPLPFLRALACVDERYRRLPRRGACRYFEPAYADGVGHHPHGVLTPPDRPSPDRTWAKLGDLDRLVRVLDRLTRMRRLVAPAATGGRFDLHLTEFGYQTSPPDHAIGVTLDQQSRYLQQAAYIAWRHPRVRSLVHYQWEDEPVRYRSPGTLAYAGWQSGLYFVNGQPKPALQGFRAPFVVDRRPGAAQARFWGQVRPGGKHTVTLLRRTGSGDFAPVTTAGTDSRGYWWRSFSVDRDAEYRFTWETPPARASGVVRVRAGDTRRLRAAAATEP